VNDPGKEEQVIKLAPSVLAADFSKIGEAVKAVEVGGADFIHLDVMDGCFVPNITFGRDMIKAVNSITTLPLDVHLMVAEPDDYVEDYCEAGADILTVHAEATHHLHRVLTHIKELDRKTGVALNPATPLETVSDCLEDLDLLLVMSVDPGFSYQKFIKHAIGKLERARKMIDDSGLDILLEIDGGVDKSNIKLVHDAGADIAVCGGGVYKARDISGRVKELKELTR
jgi:ribulose-phosphate 3-epimerase